MLFSIINKFIRLFLKILYQTNQNHSLSRNKTKKINENNFDDWKNMFLILWTKYFINEMLEDFGKTERLSTWVILFRKLLMAQ